MGQEIKHLRAGSYDDSIRESNFHLGRLEALVYIPLGALGLWGVLDSNIIQFHANSHMTINPVSEWKNPVTDAMTYLQDHPLKTEILQNLGFYMVSALTLIAFCRVVFSTGKLIQHELS